MRRRLLPDTLNSRFSTFDSACWSKGCCANVSLTRWYSDPWNRSGIVRMSEMFSRRHADISGSMAESKSLGRISIPSAVLNV